MDHVKGDDAVIFCVVFESMPIIWGIIADRCCANIFAYILVSEFRSEIGR